MNILFVNCFFHLFDNLDCGAANRSTLFVKGLSKVGHVDVVSFTDQPLQSNIENCDVVFCQKLTPTPPPKNRLASFWHRLMATSLAMSENGLE